MEKISEVKIHVVAPQDGLSGSVSQPPSSGRSSEKKIMLTEESEEEKKENYGDSNGHALRATWSSKALMAAVCLGRVIHGRRVCNGLALVSSRTNGL